MDVYNQIIERIIKQQESIIGPIAVEQAEHVHNLKVNWDKKDVSVTGDGSRVIDDLVDQYKGLFGKTSVEVCKEAAGALLSKLPQDKLPKTLA
jgi:nitric oxide reductase large subunit